MLRGRLIGLNGYARSGKDTAADKIQEWCLKENISSTRRGFADKLKESAAHALGIFDDELRFCNEIKTDTVIRVEIDHGTSGLNHQISGREFLQYYGTEAHREIFGSDFWVDALLPNTNDKYGTLYVEENYNGSNEASINPLPDWWQNFTVGAAAVAEICLVTDVRFDNEAERIKELGGEIWRIDRDGSGTGSAGMHGHASEQDLLGELIDLVIDNNGSLSDLTATVAKAMEVVTGVMA